MRVPVATLLETLAEETAQGVLSAFPVAGVRVRVTKPHVSIRGSVLDGAGVEIYRMRNE